MNLGSSRDEKDSPVTIAALHECSVCHEQFKTKRGFGQHIRHILFWQTDGASRQRKLASSVNEQPEPALKSLPRQTSGVVQSHVVWTDEEVSLLLALESEFEGVKFINKAISEHLTSKTPEDKRRTLAAAAQRLDCS